MNCPHCQTDIDEHEAGLKTDVCVAEALMEHKHWVERVIPRDYSTDIAAAWEVVGRMRDDWWELEFLSGNYRATFQRGERVTDYSYPVAEGDTAPLAICRAALKASLHES